MRFELQKDTNDPLLQIILEKYHLNLLSFPRENISIGDIFVNNGESVAMVGNLNGFMDINFERTHIITDEMLWDLSSVLSGQISSRSILPYIEAYLNSMGAQNVYPRLRSAYEAKGGYSISINFIDAAPDYINAFLLSKLISSNKPHGQSNFLNFDNFRYYIVASLARSQSFAFIMYDKFVRPIHIKVDDILTAETGDIHIEKQETGQLIFRGKKRLVFGVELYKLIYEKNGNKLSLAISKEQIRVRGGGLSRASSIEPSLVEDNSMFFRVR